jgi:hypothetical protein
MTERQGKWVECTAQEAWEASCSAARLYTNGRQERFVPDPDTRDEEIAALKARLGQSETIRVQLSELAHKRWCDIEVRTAEIARLNDELTAYRNLHGIALVLDTGEELKGFCVEGDFRDCGPWYSKSAKEMAVKKAERALESEIDRLKVELAAKPATVGDRNDMSQRVSWLETRHHETRARQDQMFKRILAIERKVKP